MRRNIHSLMIIAFAMIAAMTIPSCRQKTGGEGTVAGPSPATGPVVTAPQETSEPGETPGAPGEGPADTAAPSESNAGGLSDIGDYIKLIGKLPIFQISKAQQTVGDVTGDGVRDFVVKVESNPPTFLLYSGKVEDKAEPITSITGAVGSDSTVSIGGDLDADGYSDILIGDSRATNNNETVGAVFFFSGKRFSGAPGNAPKSLTVKDADAVVYGSTQDERFGEPVLAIGDIDNDGKDDFMARDKTYYSVYIFSGKNLVDKKQLSSNDRISAIKGSGWFGASLAKAGDVNHDGKEEIMISEPLVLTAPSVYIFNTKDLKSDIDASKAYKIIEEDSNEYAGYFGLSMSAAGDLDHDGYDDIIIGAAYPYGDDDESLSKKGKVLIFSGGQISSSTTQKISAGTAWFSFNGESNDYFGWSVAGDVDVDGNGWNDVIVGSQYSQRFNSNELKTAKGCVYIYYDLGKSQQNNPNIKCGDAYGDLFGAGVAPLGNTDKGGKASYVVSAPGAYGNKGKVTVIKPDKNQVVELQGKQPAQQFGSSISSAVR